MKFIKLLIILITLIPVVILAESPIIWSGHYTDTGTIIEISKGNLVRAGSDIEIYDFAKNQTRTVEIQSITYSSSAGAEIEIYEYDTNKYRIIEME